MANGNLNFRLNLLADTTGLQQGVNGAKFAVNALVAAMAAVGVGVSVKGLADTADSYTNLSARIAVATKDTGGFTTAMAGVQQVALMTNTSLDSTAALFTKVNDVGKQMGLTQQQSLDLTKTINMAIQTGGGSAAAADAAIVQLTQALQSGVLRGDEFNSIMEQAPAISGALSKSLGLTTGELRKMAGEGELSSAKVIGALREQSASIQADYDKFPTTIGNALQRIQTQWTILIGTMDQANGASSTVAQWMVTLADNMDVITILLDDIGEGFVWVGDQLRKVDTATIEALKTALINVYDTLKTLASTVGVAFEAVVDLINTALTKIFDFSGGVDTAQDKTNGFTKVLQAVNIALGALNDGFAAIGIGINLFVGALYSVASAWANLVSKLTWGDVRDEAIASMREMKAEADKYYKDASDGAMNFKSKAIEAIKEVEKTQKQIDADAEAKAKENLDKLLADKKTEVDGVKSGEEEKLKAVQAYAEAAIKANGGVISGVMQADLTTKGYMVTLSEAGKVTVLSMAEAKKATEENAEATKLAQEKAKQAEQEYQDFLRTSAIERISLNKQIIEAKKAGDLTAVSSAQASIAEINKKEIELNDARKARNAEVIGGINGVSKTAEVAAKGAAEALGIDLDVSLNRVSKGFKQAGGNVTALTENVKGLGIKGVEASNLIYDGWTKWLDKAKSPAEIDFAKQKLNEFQEKGVFSTKQVELGMQAIQRATAKLPADLDEVGAAFERLGIKTKEQLKLAAQSALADFNTVQASGKATAEGIKQAYERTMQAAAASGDVAVIASAKAKAASLGLEVQIDETGKASVKSMDKLSSANERVKSSAEAIGDGYRTAGAIAREEAKSAQQAWLDAAQQSNQDFRDKMKRSSDEMSRLLTYESLTRADVVSQLQSKGYDQKEAEKLAGNIWSKAMEADREAKFSSLGKSGFGGSNAVYQREFDKAFSEGRTTQSGTNKINELLRKAAGATGSSGLPADSINVNELAPPVSTPTATQTASANTPSKTVKYEFMHNGKSVSLYGSQEDGNAMDDLLNQLEAIKKSS